MTTNALPSNLAFDLPEAVRHLCERDECLKRLVAETVPFEIDVADAQSPYEVLMESITYQSISGKAAATIFGRIKALGENGRPPTPTKMLKIPSAKLRKAGLSGAKVAAMKDLSKKPSKASSPRTSRLSCSPTMNSSSAWFPSAESAPGPSKCF
jgi:3-methyladenine DNA glycosylase/8-oxoguanine DNA glycosylase